MIDAKSLSAQRGTAQRDYTVPPLTEESTRTNTHQCGCQVVMSEKRDSLRPMASPESSITKSL